MYQNPRNKLFNSGGGNRLYKQNQGKQNQADNNPRSQRYQTAIHKSQTGTKPQNSMHTKESKTICHRWGERAR